MKNEYEFELVWTTNACANERRRRTIRNEQVADSWLSFHSATVALARCEQLCGTALPFLSIASHLSCARVCVLQRWMNASGPSTVWFIYYYGIESINFQLNSLATSISESHVEMKSNTHTEWYEISASSHARNGFTLMRTKRHNYINAFNIGWSARARTIKLRCSSAVSVTS